MKNNNNYLRKVYKKVRVRYLMFIFTALAIALLISIGFALITIFLNYKLSHKSKKSELKLSPYECGEELLGEAQVRMSVQYYIYGIAYLIADIVAILILIWAIRSIEFTMTSLLGVSALLLVTLFSIAYTLKRGMLRWV